MDEQTNTATAAEFVMAAIERMQQENTTRVGFSMPVLLEDGSTGTCVFTLEVLDVLRDGEQARTH